MDQYFGGPGLPFRWDLKWSYVNVKSHENTHNIVWFIIICTSSSVSLCLCLHDPAVEKSDWSESKLRLVLDPNKFQMDPLHSSFTAFKGSEYLRWDPLDLEPNANPAADTDTIVHFVHKHDSLNDKKSTVSMEYNLDII